MIIEQSPGVKERILDSAKGLFTEKGYAGTSVRDIAAAANANVAHVKYYFGSKAKLFEIIFDEAFDILIERVSGIVDSNLPFEEMIEMWITTYYDLLPRYPQIPMFVLSEINRSPEGLVKKISQKNPGKLLTLLSERMDAEVGRGAIRPVAVLDLGLSILSLCIFPFMFGGYITRTVSISEEGYNALLKEHKEHVIDFVLRGLQP
ncbi:MAG TPA: TetR/AcrR family transcriptional regulator [Bacteroidales bacterium]|jgi:AcrR family transcriptional regulator|nr:TetR/AcrR family transcriptional regulator [Bacteroidales bacterium]